MRLPNGYGSVVKLSGKRRKPFAVRKTTGFNEKGHPIYEYIGYTATREEGLAMLAEYNKDPWNIDARRITLGELFELWLEKKFPQLGRENAGNLKSVYRHCKKYENVPYNQIRAYHMQDCIDTCGKGSSIQRQIKNLWGHLDRFALELDVISKSYSGLTHTAPAPASTRVPFSDEEVATIWENEAVPWMDSVLFLLYTGYRFSEMVNLKLENVNLEQMYLTGGNKTEAGRNKIVPIHSKIQHIVINRYRQSQSGYLFEWEGHKLYDKRYRDIWHELMSAMDMHHVPHECRHTLRSRLDSAGANKVCIDRIMGHTSRGTGERVYTHKDIDELRLNIELVTN